MIHYSSPYRTLTIRTDLPNINTAYPDQTANKKQTDQCKHRANFETSTNDKITVVHEHTSR